MLFIRIHCMCSVYLVLMLHSYYKALQNMITLNVFSYLMHHTHQDLTIYLINRSIRFQGKFPLFQDIQCLYVEKLMFMILHLLFNSGY